MTLYLDSANLDEARAACGLGFVGGVTTNPALLRRAQQPAENVIARLCDMDFAHVFYQLTAPTLAEREAEARKMLAIHTAVSLKIPCTIDNLGLAAKFVAEGVTVGLTTIFSAAQVYLASEAGAHYVVPYVNRSTRLLGDGPGLVHVMREVVEMTGARTEIIAASVKSPDEAVQALQAGAHHLALPLELIEAMGEHPLSWAAIEAFAGE